MSGFEVNPAVHRQVFKQSERPELADFRLTQRHMTAQDYGRPIDRHENRAPMLAENRNSQVPGD
jgi:hypothetical protein